MTDLPDNEGTTVKAYLSPLPSKPPVAALKKMPLVQLIQPFVFAVWDNPKFQMYGNATTREEAETGKVDFDHYEAMKIVMQQVKDEGKEYLFAGVKEAQLVSAITRWCNRSRKAIAAPADVV